MINSLATEPHWHLEEYGWVLFKGLF